MDIAGALLERVLQQPVDNIDDVLVVGIGLLHRSQLQHLLEVGHPGTSVSPVGATGPVYRAGHGIKLGGVAGDEPGIGQHPAHALAQHVFQVALPGLDVRFAAGDHHLLVVDLHREDAVALGEGPGHDLGDGGDVDPERVDLVDRLVHFFPQPRQQAVHIKSMARVGGIGQLLLGQEDQRVHPHHGGFHHPGSVRGAEPAIGVQLPCQGHQIQAVLHQLLAKITRHSSTHAQKIQTKSC